MGPEINIEPIRALEKQIEEGSGDVIELKRARNSLLNISTRVPPELLGKIFAWVVAREQDYSLFIANIFSNGLERGSHNFLLVCHHWFEVASSTPELWGFWGYTLKDWNKRCCHTVAAPVDLWLDGFRSDVGVLSAPLRDAIRDRAMQDKIRQIHLANDDIDLLASIFSSLTPDVEGVQEKHIESIGLWTKIVPLEFSNFFTCLRLQELRNLWIHGNLGMPLWDHLPSQTARLTSLSLDLTYPSPPPSTSQLISIVVSNPGLQNLALANAALPHDVNGLGVQVPLHHLRSILLEGDASRVFGLLERLEFPAMMDLVILRISNFTTEDIFQTLGPRMQDHFQRDPRFQNRPGVAVFPSLVDVYAGPIDDNLTQLSKYPLTSLHPRFIASLIGPRNQIMEKMTLDLMAFVPREHVVHLEVADHIDLPEDLLVEMPNIETLWLSYPRFSYQFLQPDPDGPHADMKLLPSLQFLHLKKVATNDDGWKLLKKYLIHQTSGSQAISLWVSGYSRMSSGIERKIQRLVKTYNYCPLPNTNSGYQRKDRGNRLRGG